MLSIYGIIGYPLTHSFSPAYFKKRFAESAVDAIYEAFPIANIDELPALIASRNVVGLNVTTPYKEAILPYMQEMDAVAAEIGAVNCVVIKNGVMKGYNTDATGFEHSLNPLLTPRHTHALILGTGGASKAVAYTLMQLGIPFQKVSRNRTGSGITYDDITSDIISGHKLIINTTPIGMYPKMEELPPLLMDGIGAHHLLYDLIYNPEETKFLALGRALGATTKNGFEMLQLQAEASWAIWAEVKSE